MKSMLKSYSIVKAIKSLILALVTELALIFAYNAGTYQAILSFIETFNIAACIIAFGVVLYVISIWHKRVYSKFTEWLMYMPLYIVVLMILGCPGTPWSECIKIYNLNLIPILYLILVFAVYKFIKKSKIFAFDVRSEESIKPKPLLRNDGESPLWCRLLYSVLDVIVMITPLVGYVYSGGMLIIDKIPMSSGWAGLGEAIIYVLILYAIIGIVLTVYCLGRFSLTLKIHKTYRSYLMCIPFYILSGVALWFSAEYNPMYYGQLFFWSTEPLEFLQPLISFVGGDEKFLAILYVIEWFVAISLVFAVRYIIKRIRAKREGQESNPEMPSETIHEAETRVCCEQNSTGEEVNLHNTVAEEAINAKQEHTN